VTLHDVFRHERDVAGRESGRDAERAPERREILDVSGRDRVSVAAQVPDPRAAAPSGGRPVHGDARLGAGGGARSSRPCEPGRQRAPQHRSSSDPHGFSSWLPAGVHPLDGTALDPTGRSEPRRSIGTSSRRAAPRYSCRRRRAIFCSGAAIISGRRGAGQPARSGRLERAPLPSGVRRHSHSR
jgi:hypothetical protein